MEINTENREVVAKYMHPNGPARSYKWPSTEPTAIIPILNVLTKINVPTTTSGGWTVSHQ